MRKYKGREIDKSKPVEVYRNLTNKNFKYSVRQSGLVVAHTNSVYLSECKFVVNEAGRQRVIKTGHRNVHAFIRGLVVSHNKRVFAGIISEPAVVKYNPYSYGKFTCYNVFKSTYLLSTAKFVRFTKDEVLAVGVY